MLRDRVARQYTIDRQNCWPQLTPICYAGETEVTQSLRAWHKRYRWSIAMVCSKAELAVFAPAAFGARLKSAAELGPPRPLPSSPAPLAAIRVANGADAA